MTDVLIIGGGAAGLMCAGFAGCCGNNVTVLEKMERPARKLMITGKGRCNLTNNCDTDTLIKNTRTNAKFLYSAFNSFTSADTMALFERLNVPLKTERGARVYPASDKSVDIVDALVGFAKRSARIIHGECASLIIENGKALGITTTKGAKIYAEKVVVATGGQSYPLTGSTGDGYRLAREAGHKVTDLRPSLIPIEIAEQWCRGLMGLSLKNITLSLYKKGGKKPVYEELGEMIFTHFGISGPLVLSASSYIKKSAEDYMLYLDLKPGLTAKELDTRLLRDFNENLNKDFINSLDALFPKKLIPVLVELSGIHLHTKVHQITKEERTRFTALVKRLPITPKALRPVSEAVITSGGVSVKEIDPYTMKSKLVENLYFIGEVLDVDAYTGGFNLQIAFSTAYTAAQDLAVKG